MTSEFALAFTEDDELVEVTPKSILPRTPYLTDNERGATRNATLRA